jgi:hypothetical protein
MKALISPNEIREIGYRVAEVSAVEFNVSQPLFWVDCAEDIMADQFWYDPVDKIIKPIPQPEPDPNIEQPISEGTQEL